METLYARVVNGVVVELWTAPAGLTPAQCWIPAFAVQFVAVPAGISPEQGWTATEANGAWTFAAPAPSAPPAPTLAQQAAAASVSGLTISSAGPTLTMAAALFPTDVVTQGRINTVVNGINTTSEFPNGAATYPMLDAASPTPLWHQFTLAQYKAVAAALLAYVAACDLIAAGNPNGATALPASSVTISI